MRSMGVVVRDLKLYWPLLVWQLRMIYEVESLRALWVDIMAETVGVAEKVVVLIKLVRGGVVGFKRLSWRTRLLHHANLELILRRWRIRFADSGKRRKGIGNLGSRRGTIRREEQRPDEWDAGFGLDLNASVEEQVQVVERVGTQYRDEGRLKRKGPDSMWEQNNESVRYDQRYHNGDQGVFPRMSRTPGEVRQCLPFEEELNLAVETSLNGSPRSP
ncbi:hypothetical protein L3X38_003246 [Prunus dulcis]|uniref:Uncharacterized protein n=1 Tax=Prunus dulcis TaxID=3755 RepID=A0AAD4ZLP3_PRUDU|nr:hypothetical protein L3X38_003246 [Prunus dulcis]